MSTQQESLGSAPIEGGRRAERSATLAKPKPEGCFAGGEA